MSLTPEQKAAVEAKGSVAVIAGAGTGKTHMLAERYLYHLAHHGFSPLQIVAVTFTDKAANELRSRIRKLVEERFHDRPDILSKVEAAQISTIHSLATRICREHYEKAEVPPDFDILDELKEPVWRSEHLYEAMSLLPPSMFQQIPFTLLKNSLSCLLADPITTKNAFLKEKSEWPDLVEQFRTRLLDALIECEIWQESRFIFTTLNSKQEDKLDALRQNVLDAMIAIEQKQNVKNNLEIIHKIDVRAGSAKKWKEDHFEQTKNALKKIRESIKKFNKEGLLTLELETIDDELAEKLNILREAYTIVSDYFKKIKRDARILDYSDLEVHALRALRHDSVQSHYAQRWRALLVDEFQDTNPVQGKILEYLTQNKILTIVGDQKQSIYGFRRADVGVFQQYQKRIVSEGGAAVEMATSFRTHHELITNINAIFSPILTNEHQELSSHRLESPHPAPFVRAIAIQAENGINKYPRQQMEADIIASYLKNMIHSEIRIYDKKMETHRPIQMGDIAILSRTWDSLDIYCDTLEAQGLQTAHAGGGNLLETMEARDGRALLQFLADPTDDLALAAVLRSPWFAVSDRILFQFVQSIPKNSSWWDTLTKEAKNGFERPAEILQQLLEQRNWESPSRLLQLADRLTGYTAVFNNLPGFSRREADWRGFMELVQELEQGNNDVFFVVRQLKQYTDAEVEIPRPPLETGNAIALMTIHAAKGLEWPVVVIPDLARRETNTSTPILFNSEFGIGLKWDDDEGEKQTPALYKILKHYQKERDNAEAKRLLYVALTRARDHLLLTADKEKGGIFDLLSPALEDAGILVETRPFNPNQAIPQEPPKPSPPEIPSIVLLENMGSGLTQLPATSLTVYSQCPKRFFYQYVLGHPGIGEKAGSARRIGTLTHTALEHGIRETEYLQSFDASASEKELKEAIHLAKEFDISAVYAPVRHAKGRERPVMLRFNRLTLNGIVDLYSHDFVLDFKTDREIEPEHHRFQLWIYAKALRVNTAYIAYLRNNYLHRYSENELNTCETEIHSMIERIRNEDFTAYPSDQYCPWCPYQEICEKAQLS